MLGTTVAGRYEIEAQIGVGGMGIVYRAHDTRLRRDVALKVIAPHLMQQESARVRFLREAQALAGLMHPHIVTIFDMAEDADSNTVFLVMELLSGHSLREYLSDGTCPDTPECPRFSAIAVPLCRALEAAHKRGVLHRDIKPENIFVCDDGELKLMDFGLARLLGDMSKNQSSTVAGTLAYMAPEQLRGDKLDARTDLYALGAVFFEFVTGTQPFMGDNPGTVLLKHLTEPPPHLRDRLTALVNANDEATLNALDDLITRLMAKDAGERPVSAAEVRGVLEQSLPGSDTLAFAVDRLLAAQGEKGANAAHNVTQFMPSSPVSVPTYEIAARLTSRQTVELPPTVAQQPTSPVLTPVASNAQPVEFLPENPITSEAAPAWKRRSVVVTGISLLGAASVLAAVRVLPHAVRASEPPTSAPLTYKQREAAVKGNPAINPAPPASSGSSAVASHIMPQPPPAPSLVSKTGDSIHPPKPAGTAVSGENRVGASAIGSQTGKTVSSPAKTASGANAKSAGATATDKERDEWRRKQEDELALIKSLRQELEAARTLKTSSDTSLKAGAHKVAPSASSAKNGAKPVKLPPLPSVAEEAKPPLVIGMKVARVERSDNKAIHISLQNDVDCYAYFYLLPPGAHEAARLFAGYEYFAAAPKTPYAIQLLLPRNIPNSRGRILIVAAKKELKSLPSSFTLSPLPPAAIAANMTGEQRQQIVRQNIHQFSDQVAQLLAASRVLQGGQLMQPHDVVIRLIGGNPMVSGRNPDGSRRNPNGFRRGASQPLSRGRRNLPPPAEVGETSAAH